MSARLQLPVLARLRELARVLCVVWETRPPYSIFPSCELFSKGSFGWQRTFYGTNNGLFFLHLKGISLKFHIDTPLRVSTRRVVLRAV